MAMTLIFELSMPSNNAWDGRWSGEENYYAIARVRPAGCTLRSGRFYYDFGDGWVAAVDVRPSSGAADTRRTRRRSQGFCGYDWMVAEILTHGRILSLAERQKASRD